MKQICVDASFVLKLLLDEPDSPRAAAHWSEWIATDCDIVAPFHLVFEVVSVLRNNVYRRSSRRRRATRPWPLFWPRILPCCIQIVW